MKHKTDLIKIWLICMAITLGYSIAQAEESFEKFIELQKWVSSEYGEGMDIKIPSDCDIKLYNVPGANTHFFASRGDDYSTFQAWMSGYDISLSYLGDVLEASSTVETCNEDGCNIYYYSLKIFKEKNKKFIELRTVESNKPTKILCNLY